MPLAAGLDTVARLAPGHGWASLSASLTRTWTGEVTATARAEVGAALTPWLDVYAAGTADARTGLAAWLGLRGTW